MCCSHLRCTLSGRVQLTISLNRAQFVRSLWSLAGVVTMLILALIETMIGEWSEDKSKHDFELIIADGIPLQTQKSITSGNMFLSDDQYVGSPVETCNRFFAWMHLISSRPFGLMVREPQNGCLALKSPPAMKRDPSVFKNCSFLIACLAGEYNADITQHRQLMKYWWPVYDPIGIHVAVHVELTSQL